MTGLGSKEAELIATIGNKGLRVFSVAEAAKLLGYSNATVSQLVHRLVNKSKLTRIEKAKYLVIPPEAWSAGEYTEEGIIIASQLVKPCYLSYWSALQFYGWTEQPSRTIYVVVQKQKSSVDLNGISVRFVRTKPYRFFGFENHWVGNQMISVAEKEKAIVDCLDQSRYAGEIVEIVKGLFNGRKELSIPKLIEYSAHMKNPSIIKRLGFLLDTLELWPAKLRKQALKQVTTAIVLLDPEAEKSGYVCADWNLRVNVNPKNLTEWINH
jgi:predicted transcriptional regulator of viral defense system